MNDPAQHLARELSRRMTEQERDQSHPNMEPKDAATLILIDRSGPEAMVLLGRRHAGHKFMPGKFVFPGGRIEEADRAMPAATELHPDSQRKLLERVAQPSAGFARGLALAAIRETFEETGILLGAKHDDAPRIPSDLWEGFALHRVLPDLANMHFVMRAITPPGRPRRFDTRFFTADASAIAHKTEGVVGPESELVELVWIPLREAKRLDMPTVTGVVLEELDARVAAGMGHDLAVPFYFMVDQLFRRELL